MSGMEERLVKALLPDSYFFRVCYPLLRYLNGQELMMLYYLLNWGKMKATRNGWFFCSMRQIMDELDMSQSSYTRSLRSLKEKGLIESKIQGTPPVSRRWLRINHKAIGEKIVELCEEWDAKRELRRAKNSSPTTESRESEEDKYEDVPFGDEYLYD